MKIKIDVNFIVANDNSGFVNRLKFYLFDSLERDRETYKHRHLYTCIRVFSYN